MLSRTGHIEYMYTEEFKALFPDAKRMKAAKFGDIAFTVQTLSIEAEFKLLGLVNTPSPKAGCDFLKAMCYRKNHSLSACANRVSALAFVIAEKKLPTQQSEIRPTDFKYFVCHEPQLANPTWQVIMSKERLLVYFFYSIESIKPWSRQSPHEASRIGKSTLCSFQVSELHQNLLKR